ncbi:diguanylate cyclase [Neobacillus sp. LXY-4]|uniref:diguanylate cyclase n=1 Tax=Neobacillus sp. LXY-4 TaxID=3379826 RepID=UPI003EE0F2CF
MARRIPLSRIYVTVVSLTGIGLFFVMQQFDFRDSIHSASTFAFLFAILILSHFMFTIPPYEKNISLDSAVFLAILFLYGPLLSLNVLFLHSIIFGIWKTKIVWWKHVFNFASYTFMIIFSFHIFILFGGEIGKIGSANLLPYVLALSGYFLVNIVLTFIYFCLLNKENSRAIFDGFTMDKTFLISYSYTLLFSLVLGILIGNEGLFGLFLFVCIAMLLSIAFNQNFQLFQDVSTKARLDYLTGLNNHGSFKEILEKEISNAKNKNQPLSLALMDLDDFKKFNDLYGHIKGDQLLNTFGKIIDSYAVAKQFISARYGGEEFAILMPGANSQEAYHFINLVRKRVNDTYVEGVEVLPYGCLSFSAGIAELEKDTYNSSELLNKADQAMYMSKAHGKNMVQIFEERLAKTSFLIEEELERADQRLSLFLSKDVQTYRHSKRVCQYAIDFSRKLNLSEHERNILALGALVHDIGKLEIPKYLLLKKDKLEPEEWALVKNHVSFGKEIIATNKNWMNVLPLVELHHERFDGGGYPFGLKDENIPKLARILCIIDSFDAMTTERPYQKTKTIDEAIDELRACSGKQFDPRFVEAFIEMIQEQQEIITGAEYII